MTGQQRADIDAVATREGITLAEVVRRALDNYLEGLVVDPADILRATFGADTAMAPPSRDEWDRG